MKRPHVRSAFVLGGLLVGWITCLVVIVQNLGAFLSGLNTAYGEDDSLRDNPAGSFSFRTQLGF